MHFVIGFKKECIELTEFVKLLCVNEVQWNPVRRTVDACNRNFCND